jgi:hypothetical protein
MRSVRRSVERGRSAEEQRREASAGARAARGKTDLVGISPDIVLELRVAWMFPQTFKLVVWFHLHYTTGSGTGLCRWAVNIPGVPRACMASRKRCLATGCPRVAS